MPVSAPRVSAPRVSAPRVSVVIAAHNYARYLETAVRSVQAQTFSDWECLIVDDASTDDTPRLAARLAAEDGRIRRLRNPRCLGESGARNAGNAAARGEWIAVLDADDWWEPEKLELQLAALDASPGAALCFSAVVLTWPDRTRILAPSPEERRDLDRTLRCWNCIPHSTVVVRRALLAAAGGYDPVLPPTADWDLWLRLLSRHGARSFVFVDRPLMHYRIHGGNMTADRVRLTRKERAAVRRSLARGGWCLRRPAAAWAALVSQAEREAERFRTAGDWRRLFWAVLARAGLSPLRRWYWGAALHALRRSLAPHHATEPPR